jgi:ankyrin repeat protein
LAKAKDDTGSTPFHYAASANNVEAIELLLENDKAPAYISDSCGLFPLHVAVKLGNLKVVTKLFELCPDSDELLDAKGRNFLHIAVKNRNFFVVSWARKNGKLDRALNVKDDEGNTPMHLAIKARNLFIFVFLLGNKKLDLGIANKKGLTPLDLATAQRKKPLNNWQVTLHHPHISIIYKPLSSSCIIKLH